MSTQSCSTCDMLGAKVVAATTRYVKLRGHLSIARMADGSERVAELDTLVERAEIDRVGAEKEYSQHKDGHAEAAKA